MEERGQNTPESQFLVKYFNSYNNIQNISRQSHEFWVWKYHAFLGGLILPIRQDIICFFKSVQESLFQIKRNILFRGPSKSNTHSCFSGPFINMGFSMTQHWSFQAAMYICIYSINYKCDQFLCYFSSYSFWFRERKTLFKWFFTISFCLQLYTNMQYYLLYII